MTQKNGYIKAISIFEAYNFWLNRNLNISFNEYLQCLINADIEIINYWKFKIFSQKLYYNLIK